MLMADCQALAMVGTKIKQGNYFIGHVTKLTCLITEIKMLFDIQRGNLNQL